MSVPAETGAAAAARVRRAAVGDLPAIVRLVGEHAEYEKAPAPPEGLAGRLERLLFGSDAPRLRCFVAESGSGEVVGYATCAPEVSTWDGAEYLHMDCLFLRDGQRGLGLGPRLVQAVVDEARALGCDHVQWQTPVWNVDAVRFYERIGARATEKLRFRLPVGTA
ncbi:GNAT family N-acetyltransferase [Streptomyces sp. TRM66268-LWL]|uniref:GNAT family N-acetyltransferase n=1 Tax=Streptomyces polyasparticus TaxID=2767826 RepID=A0ABR7S8S3_9ACTN|nr:GNAT family N-acetyltransferase [Streptomyces polyasparticus]MBC9711294.1 GNAT family N-acetyltransferase [Streptomyces polyasparticus]